MIEFLKSMGLLRNMLHGLAVVLMMILPFAEPSWNPQGADLFFSAVIPALAPIVAIIIMFDVLMCKVQKADAEEAASKTYYGNMIKAHLLVAATLTIFWMTTFWDALFN